MSSLDEPERERKTMATRRHNLVPESPQTSPYLIVVKGLDRGKRHQLFTGPTVLGRDREECALCFQDDGISRKHAEVMLSQERIVTVRDLGSTNGTLHNTTSVGDQPLQVQDGDKIQLGNEVLLELSFQSALTAGFQQELYSSAVRDSLTEVYNRGYLLDRMESEFAFAIRNDSPLALVVLDLDHFKQINDTHGHSVGDDVLKALCRVLESATKQEDVLARYGGEEFVLLFREQGLKPALQTAERLRQTVEEHVFEHEGVRLPITVSLGVALATQGAFDSSQALFEAADAALYRAKRAGRNRVCGPEDEA